MTALLLAIASVTIENIVSLKECTDFKQCQLQSINDDGVSCSGSYSCDHYGGNSSLSIESTDFIKCNGWRACAAATRKAKGNIYCNGGYSCSGGSIDARILMCGGSSSCVYLQNSVIAKTLAFCGGYTACASDGTFQVGKRLICSGIYSCRSAEITIGEDVYCSGEQACTSMTVNPLNELDPVNSVTCSGRLGCRYAEINKVDILRAYSEYAASSANINSVSLIKGYGFKSFSSSTIDSGSLATMEVKAFGSEAGYNANIICRSGATCNLVCKSKACNGLTFQCHSGSTCNILPDGCKLDNSVDNVDGTVCPTVVSGNNEISPSDEDREDDDEDKDKMDDIDLSGDVTLCNTANECEGQVISSPDSDIECNGYQSCFNGKMYKQDAIDCNAEEACFGAEMDPVYIVFCGGFKGCGELNYSLSAYGYITCTGKQSCENIIAKPSSKPHEVSCFAGSSCRGMDIESGDYDYLDCYGNMACHSMKFTTSSMIKCHGAYSCAKSEIVSSEGPYDYLQCYGRASCADSVIDIDDIIYASGFYAARNSMLSAAGVTAHGYYAMAFATIDSKHRDTTVYSRGHLSGYGATFICRSGSECMLGCAGSGCKNMDYVCLDGAICNVEPKRCKNGKRASIDDVDCPNMLTSIPPIKDYENDEIYQYQEWEIKQDYLLNELLDNYVDADTVEDLILNPKVQREEIELFGEIEISMKQGSIFNDAIKLVGIGAVLLIFGALLYLWNEMKSEKSEYLPL